MTPVGKGFVTINRDDNDLPFEVFITVGKGGMHTMADAEAIGRLTSIALRVAKGNRKEIAEKIVQQLRGIGGASHIGFGKNRVMSLADAVAKILAEDMAQTEMQQETQVSVPAEQVPLALTENSSGDNFTTPATINGKDDVVMGNAALGVMPGADLCPECGAATFVREDGCEKCYSCGYSKC
jgi:ribonucleoside-diphosphate reductase alpha chain